MKKKELDQRQAAIARVYATGKYTTTQIAKTYSITPRQVQRIAKKHGVVRDIATANKVAAPLKNYRRLKSHKKDTLTVAMRYKILSDNPKCSLCGNTDKLEVDHKDRKVYCHLCRIGKQYYEKGWK